MECHRCPHSEAVESGRYAGIPFSATPCGKCELTEDSTYTLEYDPERGAKAPAVGGSASTPERHMPESVLRDFIVIMLSLPPRARDALCLRYAGLKYAEIAKMHGVTTAAIELRHRRALKQHHELEALFPIKTAKQKVRKPHTRRMQV